MAAMLDVTGLPDEKVKYLEHLIEHWRQQNVEDISPALIKRKPEDPLDQAWQAFFQIGDTLTEQEASGRNTMTATLLSMRR